MQRDIYIYVWMYFLGGGTNHAFPNYTSISKSPQPMNQYAFLACNILCAFLSIPTPSSILTPSLITCNLLIFSSRFSPYSTRGSSSPSGRNASATRDWPTQPTRTTRDAVAFSFSQLLSFHTLYIIQNIFK